VSPECVNVTVRMYLLYGPQRGTSRPACSGLPKEVTGSPYGWLGKARQLPRKGIIGICAPPRVTSEKRRMADGLRQYIRGLVESVTPGHDGHPLALVPFNWAVRKNLFRYQGSKVKCAWVRQTSQLAPKEVAKQRDDGIQCEPLRDHLEVTHPTLSLRSAGPHGRAKTAAKFLASRFPGESLTAFPRRYRW